MSAALAAVTTPQAALATAAVTWALHSGFVLGRRGELAFTAEATVVLVGTAVVGYVVALAVRYTRRTVPTPTAIPELRVARVPTPVS